MRRTLLVLALCALPFQTLAQTDTSTVTRRDGFLTMWQALKRPALETNKAWFHDVPKGAPGHLEIIYAASRGIIDKAPDNFHPDEPLRLGEALLLLLRTRNVDNPDNITMQTLSGYLLKYPIAAMPTEEQAQAPVLASDLQNMMRTLDKMLNEEVHEASLYAEKWQGQGTAFGESFDMNQLTAAHRTYPHNTLVKVTNVANGKSVVVRINDRGPFVKGRDMDLSLASFLAIEERSKGIVDVTFERLGDVSLVTPPASPAVCKGSRTRALTRIGGKVNLSPGIPQMTVAGTSLSFTPDARLTVLAIRQPTGDTMRLQQDIAAGSPFSFTPETTGNYVLILKTDAGQRKAVRIKAVRCD